MAKQWKHTFSKFYNGQTNDAFIPTGDKYLSSNGIEPVLNPRYLELAPSIFTNATLSASADITSIVELPAFNTLYIGAGNVYYNTTEKSSVVLGTTYQQAGYLYNSSGALKVFVFDATNIIRMNADLTTKEATTAHATGDVTAVCNDSNTILYAIGSIIYRVDSTSTITNAFSATATFSPLPYGSSIKKLYIYNGTLYIFSTLGSDTIIYQALLQSSGYYAISYQHTKRGILVRDMAGNGGEMYFIASQVGAISGRGLYSTSGTDSQKIQSFPVSANAKCSFINSDYLGIIDGQTYYRYGSSIPGFPKAFVKLLTHTVNFTAITGEYLTTTLSGGNIIQCGLGSNTYQTTGEIVTMPYDAGVLWAEKSLNVVDFAYELKSGKTGASIQVQCQTNLMELVSSSTFVNLVTLNTLGNTVMRCRIDKQEILTALASQNSDFQYIRFKIIENTGLSGAYSPKVYQDILIAGQFLNDAENYL